MKVALSLAALALAVAAGTGCVADAGADVEHDEDVEETTEELVPGAPSNLAPGAFGFATLDVGQGDAAVVVAPGGCVALLDGGPTGAGRTIKGYLRSLGVARIDFAIVSHYHEDHLGGIDEVEQGDDAVPIGRVYDHGGAYHTRSYRAYDAQFHDRRVAVRRGDRFDLCGDVAFEVVASNANGAPTNDENAKSVVVKISHHELDLLVGGDLTHGGPDVEAAIAPAVGPVEVYKVHHHGSRGSSSARFLDAIRPTVSFISAGWGSYGHPHAETLTRLGAVGTDIWQTKATDAGGRGHLEVVSDDGASFTVRKNATSFSYATIGAASRAVARQRRRRTVRRRAAGAKARRAAPRAERSAPPPRRAFAAGSSARAGARGSRRPRRRAP